MRIEILYFARIRELLGLTNEQVQLPGESWDIDSLIDHLCHNRDSQWSDVLRQENLLIAVNQAIVKGSHGLCSGDEVAFFPPVSGG